MAYKSVISSNINGYDYNNKTLKIKFQNGNTYEFYNVPEDVIKEFDKSKSKGKFFYSDIKGRYDFKKINEEVEQK